MCKKQIAAALFACLASVLAGASPPDVPKLLNGHNVAECATALRYAQAAFRSTVPRLADHKQVPEGLGSTLIVDDPAIFTEIDSKKFDGGQERPSYHVLWQKNTQTDTRLILFSSVMRSEPVFALRLIPASWSPSQYDESIQQGTPGDEITEVIRASDLAPIVFQRKDNANVWIIDVGDGRDFLPNWRVYVPVLNAYQEACQIQFRPPMNHASLLLPGAVQKLDRLIVRSLGMPAWGKDRTPVGSELIWGNIAWANAALRPWAMGTPGSDLEKVDAGLLAWSMKGPAYLAQYKAMQAQYLLAEKALAAHYVKRFNLSPDQAQTTARDALDRAFRSHYSF